MAILPIVTRALALTLLWAADAAPAFAQARPGGGPQAVGEARIGVLAFRGPQAARILWQPLADYLVDRVPGWRFSLVPVTLVSAPGQIEAKGIDFLITNPGHYVELEARFGLSALATREVAAGPAARQLRYGTVIFARADSPVRALGDLRERTLAAVSPEAFGGFQMAWQEMNAQGIDVFGDLGSIRYMGFPQDAIVGAVLAGEVDAGIVRSGLLEALAREGSLDLGEVRVLNAGAQPDYPFLLSSRLYPEWPFAAVPGVEKSLREATLRALLDTQDPALADRYRLRDLWSAPLSYGDVRAVVRAFGRYREAAGDAPWRIAGPALGGALIVLVLVVMFGRGRPGPASGHDAVVPDAMAGSAGPVDPELQSARTRFDTLTRREREVLALICDGHQTRSIAARLHISPKTVEFHRTNLLAKTEAGTTGGLVRLATRLGFDQGFSLG